MKPKSRAERASEKYLKAFEGSGYHAQGSRQAAFLAGASWQKKEDIRAVKKEGTTPKGDYADFTATDAINAIKRRAKERR